MPEPIAYMKYDEKTGMASVTSPKDPKTIVQGCKFTQKTKRGIFKEKDFKVTFKPVLPKSKCSINPEIKDSEAKSGSSGSIGMVVTLATATAKAMVV